MTLVCQKQRQKLNHTVMVLKTLTKVLAAQTKPNLYRGSSHFLTVFYNGFGSY